MRHLAIVVLLLAVAGLAGCTSNAPDLTTSQDRPPAAGADTLRLEPVGSGFAQPIFATTAPGDGRLYVGEQGGRVVVLDASRPQGRATFLDLGDRVRSGGEQGLLGFAFHPDYADSGRFVVHYTDAAGDTHLAEHQRLTADAMSPVGKPLLSVDDPYANHNGGMVAFGPDGKLYLAIGDGGSAGDPQGNGQDIDSLMGKVLRLEPDGTPAAGNPFTGRDGADEVWSYGLRNPWRFSFDRATGDLWIGDVGQGEREEVSLAPAGQGGQNFGWNAWEGTHRYDPGTDAPGHVPPVWEYQNHVEGRCAITGGYVYRGEAIPSLQGTYVYGDYCSGKVWGLHSQDGQWRNSLLLDTGMSISSFGEDADGEILVLDHRAGGVHRIVAG